MSNPATFPSTRGGYYFPEDSTERTEEAPREFEETGQRAERQSGRAENTARVVEPRGGGAETDPYAYGPPATAPRETNYVSDDNLLLWLAEKQGGLYGELRERMDLSGKRSKLIEDLSHIKERIDAEDISPQEAYDEVSGLLAAYEGTPFEQDLKALFGPLLDSLDRALHSPVLPQFVRDIVSPLEMEDLSGSIESKVDALGHDDQLELIQINSLSSAINQAAQLASNLLSSSNQTKNAIVGNIGR